MHLNKGSFDRVLCPLTQKHRQQNFTLVHSSLTQALKEKACLINIHVKRTSEQRNDSQHGSCQGF